MEVFTLMGIGVDVPAGLFATPVAEPTKVHAPGLASKPTCVPVLV